MLKLKIIDIETPTNSQTIDLDLTDSSQCQEWFLGRSSRCEINLPSIKVSRLHGSISYQQGNYFYTDLASREGSFVNNERLNVNQKIPLKTRDILKIVDFLITVEVVNTVKPQPSKEEEGFSTANINNVNGSNQAISPQENKTVSKAQNQSSDPREYMPLAFITPEQMTHWQKGDLTVKCTQIIDETKDVKTFRFVGKTPVLFDMYNPGQFVTLNLNINEKKVKRSYSISSTPSRPNCLEITVKRVPPPADQPDAPQGLVSNWLHDNLRVNDEILLSNPVGKFTYFANPARKLLLISAGSGITPMMSMSRWAFDTVADLDIVFVHSAKTPKDIIYRGELDMMSARQKNFRLAYTITRNEPGMAWGGYQGRISIGMLANIAPDYRERTVYVCGPDPFMKGIKQILADDGFPMENYYEESFGGAKKPSNKEKDIKSEPVSSKSSRTVQSVTPPKKEVSPPPVTSSLDSVLKSIVIFQSTGKEVHGDNGITILDLAEQEAIEIDYSCRSGSCGSCRIKKLEGDIEYDGDPDALNDMDKEEGYILSCIAIPKGRVVVDEADHG
ncbi:2Fe-2S iron-sulfur cluster-binding protein [Geminocystis sp. CENA526]|uniref:2Fe-2S iron-sulfur cluster-binding protein n=1 Tax=Geminocystis sp. CENA526 TaxID=1355871 RepID=UPI003D6ED5DA